jgi:hypothetical protein
MRLCNGKTHLFLKDADSKGGFVERIHRGITSSYFTSHFTIQKMNISPASIQNRHD